MAAEGLAFMLQARPSTIIHVGIGGGEQGRQLHTPIFDFNDEALPIGAYWARHVARGSAGHLPTIPT
jgi:metal-dependent amidase/aminoacylase/carboxypeptidase family protein